MWASQSFWTGIAFWCFVESQSFCDVNWNTLKPKPSVIERFRRVQWLRGSCLLLFVMLHEVAQLGLNFPIEVDWWRTWMKRCHTADWISYLLVPSSLVFDEGIWTKSGSNEALLWHRVFSGPISQSSLKSPRPEVSESNLWVELKCLTRVLLCLTVRPLGMFMSDPLLGSSWKLQLDFLRRSGSVGICRDPQAESPQSAGCCLHSIFSGLCRPGQAHRNIFFPKSWRYKNISKYDFLILLNTSYISLPPFSKSACLLDPGSRSIGSRTPLHFHQALSQEPQTSQPRQLEFQMRGNISTGQHCVERGGAFLKARNCLYTNTIKYLLETRSNLNSCRFIEVHSLVQRCANQCRPYTFFTELLCHNSYA